MKIHLQLNNRGLVEKQAKLNKNLKKCDKRKKYECTMDEELADAATYAPG